MCYMSHNSNKTKTPTLSLIQKLNVPETPPATSAAKLSDMKDKTKISILNH